MRRAFTLRIRRWGRKAEIIMSDEGPIVKEGYLVKKGHLRHNWRTRWFVLRKATLSYYKKREDTGPAGVIPLVAAVLQCPSQHISKKPWLICIATSDGKEYLIQAGDQRVRDEWRDTIQECIRMLDPSKLGKQETLTRVNGRTSDEERNIVQAMQDKGAGVPLYEFEGKTKSKMTKPYVKGCDVIEWLMSWSFASSREEAVAIATTLLSHGYFYPLSSGDTTLAIDTGSHSIFCDSDTAPYAFVSFSPLEEVLIFTPQQDSGSEESDSEEEDFVYIKQQEVLELSGTKALKQGFLRKKVRCRMRNKWKPRKFVLLEKVPFLFYYKGSKDEEKSAIPIKDTTVTGMDDENLPGEEETSGHTRKLPLKNRFVLITAQGVRYELEASSLEEKKEWMRELKDACDQFSSNSSGTVAQTV